MIAKKYRFYYTLNDWVDVRFTINEFDEIIKLSVNYTALINDKACSIIRCDNAHGYLHVHKYWEIEPEIITSLTNQEVIKKASLEIDINKNWIKYRRHMEKILGDMLE